MATSGDLQSAGRTPQPPGPGPAEPITAAGAVLQAFADGTLEVPAARQAEPASTELPAPKPETRPAAGPRPPRLPADVRFRPRTGRRRLLTVLLVVGLAGTAVAAFEAYADPGPLTLRITATLAILTGVVAFVRAGTTVAQVSMVGGRLELVRDGTRLVFDLTDRRTQIEVHGRPGQRGWRVVIPRRGMDPVVIDSRIVDPQAFTAVLEQLPDPGPRTNVPS